MTRLAGVCVLLGVSVTACTSGDDGSTNPNPNGHVCGATYTLTGAFSADPSSPAPSGYTGCWPAGTWTFAAQMMDNNCSQTPMVQSSYSFKGQQGYTCLADEMTPCSQDSDCASLSPGTCDLTAPIVDKFTLLTPDPTMFRNIVKVSELGNAICEGEVDLYSADGLSVWEFRPDLQQAVNGNLTGQGTFDIYTANQWPF
jgi:hypothetical protein